MRITESVSCAIPTVRLVQEAQTATALLVLTRLPQLICLLSYVHAALVITTLGRVVRVVVLSVQVVPGVLHTVSHVLTLTVRLSQELARVLTRTPK